MRYLIL